MGVEKFIEIHGNGSRSPIQSTEFFGCYSLDQAKLPVEVCHAAISNLLRNACNVRTVVHQESASSPDSKPHDVCNWRELGVSLEDAMESGRTYAGNFSEFGHVDRLVKVAIEVLQDFPQPQIFHNTGSCHHWIGQDRALLVVGEATKNLQQQHQSHVRRSCRQAFDQRPHFRRSCSRKMDSAPSLFEHGADAGKFRHESHQLAGPCVRKPGDDRDVGLLRINATCRTPGVRQVGSNKHDVSVLVFPHVIADQALSAAVQRECQLVFRMVMPFKRNSLGEPSIEHRDRRQILHPDFFECRLQAFARAVESKVARIVSEVASAAELCGLGAI